MKKMIIALMALANVGTEAATVTVKAGYYNKYLAFGSGSVLHGGPVIQSSVEVSFENGIFLGVWSSYSPDGYSNLGDEVDYTIGWNGEIFEGWNTTFLISYFDEPGVGKFGAGDIWYFKNSFSRPIGDYTFSFTTRLYVPTSGSGFEGGWLIGPSISRGFEITEELSLYLSLALNYDDGGFGLDDGFILNPYIGLNWKANENFSWEIVSSNIYVPLGVSDSRETDIMWGTTLA